MSATGCFFWTILPPSFSMLFKAASISATSTVITVVLFVSLFLLAIPPLMAPTSLGIRVVWSTSAVFTMWYSIPGYWLMSHPKACLYKLLARSTLSAGISKCTTLLWCIFFTRDERRENHLIKNRYTILPFRRIANSTINQQSSDLCNLSSYVLQERPMRQVHE